MCLMLSRGIEKDWFPLGICLGIEASTLEGLKNAESHFPLYVSLKFTHFINSFSAYHHRQSDGHCYIDTEDHT